MRHNLAVILLLAVGSAQASPIEYVFEGVGSGSLNGSVFSDASFQFVFSGDTDNLYYVDCGLCIVIANPVANGQISIDGFGTGVLTTVWDVFVNLDASSVGFAKAPEGFPQLFMPIQDYYELDSAYGPVTSFTPSALLGVVGSSIGPLDFSNISELTFTATTTVVPIPAAVWLFGSGLGLLGWMRRRQAA